MALNFFTCSGHHILLFFGGFLIKNSILQCVSFNKYKTFSVLIYSTTRVELGKAGNYMETGRGVFIQFRIFPTSTSVDITVYQYGKNVLYLFYNIVMSKARRMQKIFVFTSGGKFSVFTLSYVNTALNQSAFRIHKCYITINN